MDRTMLGANRGFNCTIAIVSKANKNGDWQFACLGCNTNPLFRHNYFPDPYQSAVSALNTHQCKASGPKRDVRGRLDHGPSTEEVYRRFQELRITLSPRRAMQLALEETDR